MLLSNHFPTQSLNHPILEQNGISLAVKRLDMIHPTVSGNKFYKLKYNLQIAKKDGCATILTFGGAFSNHIHATAHATALLGLKSIGIIRGERTAPLNPTLAQAEKLGMKLMFVDRSMYRLKGSPELIERLREELGEFHMIPEGGTNALAIAGTSEIITHKEEHFNHIAVPIGTGGTFAGLVNSSNMSQKIIGFSSLKGEFIHQEMNLLLANNRIHPSGTFEIFSNYHFGGYAKYSPKLIDFIWWFHEHFDIVLDPVYTAKMTYGVWDLIHKDKFPAGSNILLIHTGGLQGNLGFTEMSGIRLPIPSQ